MQVNFNILNNIWRYKAQNQEQTRKNVFVHNPFAQAKSDTFVCFRGNYCSPKNFQVKSLPNLHCPACGQIMMSKSQIEKYVNYVGNKKGEELIAALEKYEDESVITGKPSKDKSGYGVYRPFKKDVVDVYKRLAYENPNDDLLGLTKKQARICIENLIAQQMLIVEELRTYINNNFESQEERDALLEKIKTFEKQIKGEADETFARKKFVSVIKNATNSTHAQEVEKIISKMPSSESDINSFFVKYSRAKSAKEIASKFVQQTQPTTEHLKPQSLGGSDSLSNYICDCEDCNNRRGTTPFYDWIQTLPGFEERLQEYINEVRIAIDNKKLDKFGDEYDTYIEAIVETLEEMSEGEIILDIPEVTNPQKKANALKKRAREISQLKAQHEQLQEIARQFRAEIMALKEHEDFQNIYEYYEVSKELEELDKELASLNARIQKLRAPLYELQKEVEALKSIVESTKNPADVIISTKEYEKKLAVYNKKNEEYDSLNRRIGKLQRKKISLKKQKKPYAIKEKELDEKIVQYGNIVGRANALNEKIAKLGNFAQKEANLTAQAQELEAEIVALKAQNSEIMTRGIYTAKNTSNYNKYCHQKDLLRTAENLLQSRNITKLDGNTGMTKEVIEIAVKTIRQTIADLEGLDEVQYFVNMSKIGAKDQERTRILSKLEEVTKTRLEAQALQQQIDEICAGESLEDIRAKYLTLSQEKKVMSEIAAIDDKKAKLNYLTKVLQKNESAFSQLEYYQDLTNIQYSRLISMIEVEDVI